MDGKQTIRTRKIGRILSGIALGLSLTGMSGQGAIASTHEEVLLFLTEPFDLQVLNPDQVPTGDAIVTEHTISQTGLTIPSLWWAQQQFGGKLLTYWVAYSGNDGSLRRIDLLINQPVWSAISYVDRYEFIHHFGLTSREFGYNTRLFNREGDLLGAYFCNPTSPSADSTCQIFLQSIGQGALEGRSNPFSAPPTGGGSVP